MTLLLPSLTLIAVVDDEAPGAAQIRRFAAVLEQCVLDFELVLVANGVAGHTSLALKALAGMAPDLTAVFLDEAVHPDLARLVGIEHAVGDYVLFADVLHDDPAWLPVLLAPLREGYDLVVADRGCAGLPRPWLEGAMLAAYGRLFRLMTGAVLDLEPTGLRVFSRAASLSVAARPDAELRLRTRSIGPSFPATTVPVPPGPTAARPLRHPWSKGIGLLLSASTLPLRSASYAALLGGGLSALYSLYIFAVYLLQHNVAAGWTTLSLQLSGMMFVFSIVLLFLSEYVIQIHTAAPPRSRRYLVVRELRSPLSRRTQRLNVVDADGRFQLGKPGWLLTSA